MGKNISQRTKLQQLADALDLTDPKDLSDQSDTTPIMKNKRGNWRLCRNIPSSVRPSNYDAESFELMVLPCGDTSEIFNFVGHLDMMLHDADSYGDILRTSFNSNCSVTVTMEISLTKFNNLVHKLSALSGVKEITEELQTTGTLMGHDQKSKVNVLSRVDSDRSFQVLMNKKEAVHQEESLPVPVYHR